MGSDRLQYALAASVGMVLGAFVSLIVDSALFEIGESGFFASVFGICLIIIGGLIIWRAAPQQGEKMSRWRWMVFIFSSMVLTSGFCCFILEKHWIHGLSSWAKLPMYTMLGTSLSFALTFSLLDIINSSVCLPCQGMSDVTSIYGPNAASSSKQVYVVLFTSVFMGAIFGLSFGLIDVEDDTRQHTRFDEDQAFNTFVGALTGSLVGGANQYLRDKALAENAPYVNFEFSNYEDDY